MRQTSLDRQWEELMNLCRQESTLKREDRHPKLVKLLASQIEKLALELGFDSPQIQQREFRAERSAGHIVRMLTD